MGALQGAASIAFVLLLTEITSVAPIPQRQVDNRIVNQPQGSLLVPNRQNQGNNVGQSQPGIQQQNFPSSPSASAPSRPDDLLAAQGHQNTRNPQVQVHQNLPDTSRPSRPAGRPQSASAGFESNTTPGRREKHSSCGKFPSPGQCQAAFPRYYYNASMSQCECYLFGGCDEADGSYRNLEECHEKCLPERREEGPSCRHVYIENFHPVQPTRPPVNPFPGSQSAAQGPSSRPFGNDGQNQPSEGGRPFLNSPENARPQAERPHGNRNPNGGSGFQGHPNANTGSPNFSNGSPNFNTGSPNINNGAPSVNSGSPNINNGAPSVNSGSQNINNGASDFNNRPPNFNTGSPNLSNGSPNFNNGSPSVNSGSPNINNGAPNFNNGSPNFNNESPNVNNGQRIPTSANGRPVSNQPSRDSQAFRPPLEATNTAVLRSPANKTPNFNPTFPSENVRFPAEHSALGVVPFVQPGPLFAHNAGFLPVF